MMNNKHPLISIVILNYNGEGFLDDCLKSVLGSNYDNFEVVLVDNASSDNSLQSAEVTFGNDKRLKIVKNKTNLLFTGGNNIGINNAQGDIIIILNNDTEIDKECLKEIAFAMQDEEIGAAQPKILKWGSLPIRIEYVGGSLDRLGYAQGIGQGEVDKSQFDHLKDIFYAAGTVMILRKKILDEVGLFDEKFGMHWEDTDLSWRIRLNGKRIVPIPKAIAYHKGSKTMSKFAKKESVAWYIRKNRIAGLIKNYGLLNLIKYLPLLILSYFILFIKEFIFDRSLKLALSSILAILWNIKEMPYLIRKRKIVQKEIRRVGDKKILEYLR